jgi:formylglycine-generating enzyme required for sulfatase activity
MRLFISYARVDKPYCTQIVNTLDFHEPWYDQRLYAGQHWWKEILRRLDWCEGFVYLLSPDSVASEYCCREFELAQNLGRHIFPILIREGTTIPESLEGVQYADFSKGITPESVKVLLSSIYLAERQGQPVMPVSSISPEQIKPPSANPATVISVAAEAMEKGQFDQAVFLLKQAKSGGYTSRFINLDAILAEAELALERQAYLREAEREYKQIFTLVKHKRTRKLGLEAYEAFSKAFPDYDPENILQMQAEEAPKKPAAPSVYRNGHSQAARFSMPLLEWCDIPQGIVSVDEPESNGSAQRQTFYVDAFRISRFPITNAQFQIFLDDPTGYANVGWWQYSEHAHNWRLNNPQPKPSRFKGDERPREMVNWYDALAFCYWLGEQLGLTIMLPTGHQWQRAARGDDHRLYPWGDVFDPARCNTRESDLKMTTLVNRYENGSSPYNVCDMAGNIWEWCLVTQVNPEPPVEITSNEPRAVFGGSFLSVHQRSQISFHYFLKPESYHASLGFRIVQVPRSAAENAG